MARKTFTLSELAKASGGRLVGADLTLSGADGLESAGAGDLTFVRTKDQAAALAQSKAAAAAVPNDFPASDRPVIVHENPRYAFAVALLLLDPPERPAAGVHPSAVVAPDAILGPDVSIGPFAVVETGAVIGRGTAIHSHAVVGRGSKIGEDCRIDPHAVIYRESEIGDRTIIFAGAIVGCDGFGFEPWKGRAFRMNHIGKTVIGKDAELGANTCVDRATTGKTSIGDGTKIDNLVMVGHNCTIGRGVLIASQSGVAGSSKVGNGVIMGGKCGIADHAEIGDLARLAAGTGVMKHVPAGATYMGFVGQEHRSYLRELAAIGKLPQLLKDFESMRRELEIVRHELARLKETGEKEPRG